MSSYTTIILPVLQTLLENIRRERQANIPPCCLVQFEIVPDWNHIMRIILTYIAECDHRSGGQVVRIVQENGGDTFPLVTPTPIMRAMFGERPIRPRHIGTREELKWTGLKDKKLKGKLKRYEVSHHQAAIQAARSELLLTEEPGYLEAEGLEKTYKFRQHDIAESVDIASAQKYFELKLDKFGPYRLNYTKNGRFLLLGGRRGHIATMDWENKTLGCEVHVQETVRDVRWLHIETMFAVAQKKYVYIYDNTGLELHCLKTHSEVNRMEFLPYHFLLATVIFVTSMIGHNGIWSFHHPTLIPHLPELSPPDTAEVNSPTSSIKFNIFGGNYGILKYQDVSTGKPIAQCFTKLGRCDCMTQNSHNAIIHLGHHKGTVTLWSPTVQQPLVKMLCHRGPVQAVAIDKRGLYMATSGLDGQMKIWDVRTYKQLQAYYSPTPASSLSISQRDLLAVGFGPHVKVWRDAFREKQKYPYMTHLLPSSSVHSLQFCPYEDVLGVGHSKGFASLLIPGSGEPNFDAMEANPYQTKKQRQEFEVKALLEKIQPELITLDPMEVNRVDRVSRATLDKERQEKEDQDLNDKFQPKHKKKGRSSSGKRHMRKKGVEEEERKEKMREEMAQKREEARLNRTEENRPLLKSTLDRFTSKSKS